MFNKMELRQEEKIVDVYRENSRAELTRCITAVNRLLERVCLLKELWPEVTVLENIIQQSQKLFSFSVSVPQMQLSAFLERLLG
ncbi:unnamed protein product [Gongylonema pulchrum]|uniref:NR LBD domain-containing protein n=1 Tax=Gongylonema pulchrum TaxID=637853 RepID=A0A183EZ79_9BILA|nr:unnamed protein product [Gongylonema pulchrum]